MVIGTQVLEDSSDSETLAHAVGKALVFFVGNDGGEVVVHAGLKARLHHFVKILIVLF